MLIVIWKHIVLIKEKCQQRLNNIVIDKIKINMIQYNNSNSSIL